MPLFRRLGEIAGYNTCAERIIFPKLELAHVEKYPGEVHTRKLHLPEARVPRGPFNSGRSSEE